MAMRTAMSLFMVCELECLRDLFLFNILHEQLFMQSRFYAIFSFLIFL